MQSITVPLVEKDNAIHLIKIGIWAYFFLLIFEGALRKWFLPGLAAPLLVVRDPIALWLIVYAWKKRLLPGQFYMITMIIIGIIGIYATLLFGHGNISVAIFGARILIIHFPLMFVMGQVFNHKDVVNIGKAIMWLSIPMVILIALQFYNPQSAWVNRGVGGDMEGAGFSGALGYFRPSGTFSFTNGITYFYSLAACFVLFFWISPHKINKILLLCATSALIIAIPFSISRALFFQIGVTIVFAILAISRNPEYLGRMAIALIGICIGIVIIANVNFMEASIDAFTHRFETANESEGGLEGVLLDRYLGGMIGAIRNSSDLPFFGFGIGMGTNVGSFLMTGEKRFLISEGEWGRVIGEVGFLFGLLIIIVRLGFCTEIALASYKKLAQGELLPWLLLGFALLTIPQAQWAQPTALGFSSLIGGLMIASLKTT